MNTQTGNNIIEASKEQFRNIISENDLSGSSVTIQAKTLTPEEAIGNPTRRDYPIIEGKERMVEAEFCGARGHAFTDSPLDFMGYLDDILALKTDSNQNRAVYLATLNAVLKYLGKVHGTIHCKNNEPEDCARQIADHIRKTWGNARIGLIGLNPAIAETLVNSFGSDRICTTDLDYKNIGTLKYNIPIWDGRTRTEELVRESDVVLATGTTLGNGSFDGIWSLIQQYNKPYLFYGVTVAGISELMGINRICPYGADA